MGWDAKHVGENIEPVLIVGGGPVGLALAGDLGWRGIALRARSSRATARSISRAWTSSASARWNSAAAGAWCGAVEASPYPRDYAQDNIYLTSLTGYELGRERFPGIGQAPPPQESPQQRERCPQDMFDPILRAFAASQPKRRRCATARGWSRSRRTPTA